MMGANELLCALGFALIFECLMPLIAPAKWKKMIAQLQQVPDSVVTRVAAGGILIGLAVVWMLQSGTIGF